MKKIIGGLLVVSLLSRPSVMYANPLAYELLKENRLVCVVKSEELEKQKLKRRKEIDDMMSGIYDKTRLISSQLKEKAKVIAQIQTKLDALRYAKVSLDEHQVDAFAKFIKTSGKQGAALASVLQKIEDNKDLNMVKNELLHNNADYDLIYDELKAINDYQQEAMETLNAINREGHKMLDLLQFD